MSFVNPQALNHQPLRACANLLARRVEEFKRLPSPRACRRLTLSPANDTGSGGGERRSKEYPIYGR